MERKGHRTEVGMRGLQVNRLRALAATSSSNFLAFSYISRPHGTYIQTTRDSRLGGQEASNHAACDTHGTLQEMAVAYGKNPARTTVTPFEKTNGNGRNLGTGRADEERKGTETNRRKRAGWWQELRAARRLQEMYVPINPTTVVL
jgi:hypothetical protein